MTKNKTYASLVVGVLATVVYLVMLAFVLISRFVVNHPKLNRIVRWLGGE